MSFLVLQSVTAKGANPSEFDSFLYGEVPYLLRYLQAQHLLFLDPHDKVAKYES